MIRQLLTYIGEKVITTCTIVGTFTLFIIKVTRILFSKKLKVKKWLEQIIYIGVDSIPVVLLTGMFTGMVFALQSYIGFRRVGGEQFISIIVALGMVRELGPVLTSLMVTGRAGSAIAAEIGTMNITEQIDALQTLRINPIQYLIIPRILAGTFILPFLSLFSSMIGIIGGYIVSTHILGLNGEDYISNIQKTVEMKDIMSGLVKACIFGLILTSVGSFKGFYTTGGARGVGVSTTQSVVLGSISILISNYFLTKLLEQI